MTAQLRTSTKYARTDETHDEALFNEVPEDRRKVARGIEVGQIFYFGTKYSEALGAKVQGPDGKPVAVHMGPSLKPAMMTRASSGPRV